MEKRAHLRVNFSTPAPKRPDSPDNSKGVTGGPENEIISLSASGACIVTTTKHEAGKRILFEMNLSDVNEKVVREATVQWVRPEKKGFRVGLKFV